jgi:hypothetical protein
MVRTIVLILLLGTIANSTYAQESDRYPGKGLFRASATFGVGLMTRSTVNGYLHGFLEYYVDDRISLRGGGLYFLFSDSKTTDTAAGINLKQPLLDNHQLRAGMFYHFGKHASFDPYIGLQPGIALSRYNEVVMGDNSSLVSGGLLVNPTYTLSGGFNYYSGKYFHLFVEARYTRGIHMATGNVKYLDELGFCFGLGFDIKKK